LKPSSDCGPSWKSDSDSESALKSGSDPEAGSKSDSDSELSSESDSDSEPSSKWDSDSDSLSNPGSDFDFLSNWDYELILEPESHSDAPIEVSDSPISQDRLDAALFGLDFVPPPPDETDFVDEKGDAPDVADAKAALIDRELGVWEQTDSRISEGGISVPDQLDSAVLIFVPSFVSPPPDEEEDDHQESQRNLISTSH
jgi:hypothetical protein